MFQNIVLRIVHKLHDRYICHEFSISELIFGIVDAISNDQQWLTKICLLENKLRAAYSVNFYWAYLLNS